MGFRRPPVLGVCPERHGTVVEVQGLIRAENDLLLTACGLLEEAKNQMFLVRTRREEPLNFVRRVNLGLLLRVGRGVALLQFDVVPLRVPECHHVRPAVADCALVQPCVVAAPDLEANHVVPPDGFQRAVGIRQAVHEVSQREFVGVIGAPLPRALDFFKVLRDGLLQVGFLLWLRRRHNARLLGLVHQAAALGEVGGIRRVGSGFDPTTRVQNVVVSLGGASLPAP